MRYSSIFILILLGHLLLINGCNEEPVKVPSITSFTPLTARVDSEITILGTNFSERAANNIVRINGKECTLLYSSVDSLVVRAVPGVNSGKVSVTIGNLAAVSFDDFILKPQTVTSVSPAEGVVGDEITITGSNYGNSIEDVRILFYDSIPAEIYDYTSVGTADTIKTFKTKVPEGAETGKVTIWIDSVSTESENEFTVIPN